jgi:ribonuclease E
MTRKRVGQGLLEVFSEPCEHCRGRGVIVHTDPVDERRRGGNGHAHGGGNGGGGSRREEKPRETREERAETGPAAGPGDEAENDGGGRSGRRNRGRRNRAQAGEDRAAEDAAVLAGAADDDGSEAHVSEHTDDRATGRDDAVPTTGEAIAEAGEAALLPAAEAGTVTGQVATGEDPEETADQAPRPAEDAAGDPAVSEAQQLPAAAAGTITGDVVAGDAQAGRPRRRRAASRPAGPPAE